MKVGLVLEGGGLRGVFSTGVLDYFLEKEWHFPYVIGVSMGACNATSYISRQKGRNKKINIGLVNDKRYLSFWSLITKGSLFGMDFIFDEIPNSIVPFDYDTFDNSEQEFVIVTTDCATGKPLYFTKEQCKRDINNVLRASSSLPLIAKVVEYNNLKLLDGGLTDSIPVKKAFVDGCDKAIVVLTRHKEYRKKPGRFNKMVELAYKDYPLLIEAITRRYEDYNKTLEHLENLENEGKLLVIRPSEPLKVSRIERNKAKLENLYNLGFTIAKEMENKVEEFVNS